MYGLIRCSGELYVVQWGLCMHSGFNALENYVCTLVSEFISNAFQLHGLIAQNNQ